MLYRKERRERKKVGAGLKPALCITMVESFRSLRKFCPDSKLLNQ